MNPKAEHLLQALKTREETVGFVESCTGGLLSADLTQVPGASEVFKGSIVSYSNESKAQIVGVSPEALETFGAVSEEVAKRMAQGGRIALNVDWCVSITGIAGPTGGTKEKPVGTVWFALIGPQVEKTFLAQFSGDRESVQKQSVAQAFDLLLECFSE